MTLRIERYSLPPAASGGRICFFSSDSIKNASGSELFGGGPEFGEAGGVLREVAGGGGADGFVEDDFPAEEIRDAMELVGDELVFGIAEGIRASGHAFVHIPDTGVLIRHAHEDAVICVQLNSSRSA